MLRRCRPALGTFVEISVQISVLKGQEHSEEKVAAAIDSAFDVIEQVERLMSEYIHSSDVSRINNAVPGESISVHSWTFTVLQAAQRLFAESGGLFDIVACCYGADVSVKPSMSDLIINAGHVELKQPLRISLNGIAKGFAVDQGIATLQQFGLTSGIINAGGDIAVFGDTPYEIPIRSPNAAWKVSAIIELENASLATSACYSNIATAAHINCLTGAARSEIESVTVVAPTCMLADGLAKIALLSERGAPEVMQVFNAKAYRLLTGRSLTRQDCPLSLLF